MVWQQVYDPLSNMWLSTLLAAIPVVVMLVGLGFLHMKAHLAAGAGLVAFNFASTRVMAWLRGIWTLPLAWSTQP